MGARPRLDDPVADFLNRSAEKRTVRDFSEGREARETRCLLVRTTRDVGLTFFLQHLERTMAPQWFAVYADCASSDPEVIFRKFFDRLSERKLLQWHALSGLREFGDAAIRALASLLVPPPLTAVVGPIAGAVIPKVATTPYSSVPSERFAKLVTGRRWRRPVLFLVDNAQEIKPQSLHILKTVYADRYAHVRFILSYVADPAEPTGAEVFEDRLRGLGLGVRTLEFGPPDQPFVEKIAHALQVPLSAADAGEVLRKTGGRISRIIGMLHGAGPEREPLSPLEREILRYLLVAEQPLRRSDVLSLVLRSPRIAAPDGSFDAAVASLEQKRVLVLRRHWLGDEVEIADGHRRAVRAAVPSLADLVAAQELYRFFSAVEEVGSPNHSQSAYAALLYKLAKDVDPAAVAGRAFELVRISLLQADLAAAEHYVLHATGGSASPSLADRYTLLAFQVSVQEFAPALRTLDELGREYWYAVRALRIIHAIALNRVRAHGESAVEIDQLLNAPETTHEEFALLSSYRVSGLLHEGELRPARDLFERSHRRIRLARNRGYALRNCAAVYFWGSARDAVRAAEVLEEAAGVFRGQQDAFGLYTTLNNRAALLGLDGPVRESAARALPQFQEVFQRLAVFGTQHLEEVGANVGIALFLNGSPAEAEVHLRKVAAIASFDFPRVLMESALAFCEVLSGNPDVARVRMKDLTDAVAAVKLPEAVYRANVNAAAVEAAARGNSERLQRYLDAAGRSGYWGGTSSLERVRNSVNDGTLTPATLPEHLSFDYFHYWSQNPLSFVSAPLLPAQAVRHDVGE